MGLFGKKKESTEKNACECGGGCGCGSGCGNNAPQQKAAAGVKVLGSGCAKCNELEQATKEALAELGMDTTVEHVTDFAEIAAYGVMSTPALVVDGKVAVYGKVLKKEEVVALLRKIRG